MKTSQDWLALAGRVLIAYLFTGTTHIVNKRRPSTFLGDGISTLTRRDDAANEEQTAHLQTALLHRFSGADPDTNRSARPHSIPVVVAAIGSTNS